MFNFNIESVGQVYMTSIDTGEKFDLGEARNLTHEFEMSPYEECPIRTFANTEFSCEAEFDQAVFDTLWSNAIINNKAMEGYIDIPCVRQKRTHKKKRINKKWAKRYGYENYAKRVFAKQIIISPEDFPSGIANFEIAFDPEEAAKFYHKDVVRKY